MSMTPLNLLILALFTWRVSYMMVKEAGPFNVFIRLRAFTDLGGLLLCVNCMSVWIALLGYALLVTDLSPLVYVGAISGGALMLHKYTGWDYGNG